MKLLHDWHIPDWDRHYENVILQYNNKWSYQQRQRDFALNKVKEWDIAIETNIQGSYFLIEDLTMVLDGKKYDLLSLHLSDQEEL